MTNRPKAQEMETEGRDALLQRRLRMLIAIGIGVAVAWFLVEVFFPAPFPNVAH